MLVCTSYFIPSSLRWVCQHRSMQQSIHRGSSDLTGRARSGPAGNAHSVVANAIIKEIAASRFGPFVTIPMSVARESARARLIMADDGINSWKFHVGANYIGQHSTTAVKATLPPI